MRLTPVALAAVLLLAPLSACSDDEPTTSPTPTASATTSQTPTTDAPPATSADLVVAPGRIGAAEVGMSQDDAVATGLFDADVEYQDEVCEGIDLLRWKEQFEGVDVLTDEDGTIVSMGVWDAAGPRTEVGFGVDTTFDELIEGFGEQLSEPESAGYGQVGVWVQDGQKWLGFLFGQAESVEQLGNDHGQQVTFMEVTTDHKPALIRDGC